jgi:thiol-disulfide isomerase/thioredoxin
MNRFTNHSAPYLRQSQPSTDSTVFASLVLPVVRTRADQPTVGGVLAENFTWLTPPTPVPTTPITMADGQETTLPAFQGQVVLLNFWATWCAPCIREMPSLDRLQAKLKGEGLEVIRACRQQCPLAPAPLPPSRPVAR